MTDSPGIHLPKNIFHPKKTFPVFIPKIDKFFKKSHNHVKEEIFRSKKNFLDFIPTLIRPRKKQKKTTPKKFYERENWFYFYLPKTNSFPNEIIFQDV